MSVEPPVVSPATLTEAFELMAGGSYRPLAGGTDLMVQLEADVVGAAGRGAGPVAAGRAAGRRL